MSDTKTSRIAVMSGMRPTGRLHLGHYIGVLKNWVRLQHEYPCFYMVADWHALTTQAEDPSQIPNNTHEIILDWLASGLDPEKCTLYVQSDIPEIAQIHLLFSMITPAKWCETDPTLKDMVAMLRLKASGSMEEPASVGGEGEGSSLTTATAVETELSYGLLGYPVLQTADILVVRGTYVPVGKDQLAHLEISRDIARRFNYYYKTDLLPEPKPLLTDVPMLAGLDGRKMGKSFNNAIFLAENEDETWKKIRAAITDPARIKRDDPGNPDACVAVFPYYQAFGTPEDVAATDQECRAGTRGCVDCKKRLAEIMNASLAPLRERRTSLAQDPGQVQKILKAGTEKAREEAALTLSEMKRVMGLASSLV